MLILDTLRYKHWADLRTLDAVAKMDGHRFPSALAFAHQQLNHMIRVEELFRARLMGGVEPHATTNSESVPEFEVLSQRLSTSNVWLQSYAATLTLTKCKEFVHFQFVDGQRGSMTREEVLFHLVNHGTYHRGAIGHALDLAEALRPADTYTVYIHSADPSRRG